MKVLQRALFLFFLAVLSACSEDAFVSQPGVIPNEGYDFVDLISINVPDIEIADATTRSLLFEEGDELKFTWQENDAIGVVPMDGRPLSFPIHAENAGKNRALFDGGGWALKSTEKYAAFFPINKSNQETDIRHIVVDYRGQTQDNYADYDFLATCAVKPSNGHIEFNMTRLSAILKITVKMPYNSRVRYCTMKVPDPVFGVKGTLDLSGTEPVYTPELMLNYIETDLEKELSSTKVWSFSFYLMIPPVDLTGKYITINTMTDDGFSDYGSVLGQNFEAGKAYQLTVNAMQAIINNQNLIAAAKKTAGVSFSEYSDGTISVNQNLEQLKKVVELDVMGLNDPTVCDELRYFPNLEYLTCDNNQITTLDLSKNTQLKSLYCSNNQLVSLEISNNTGLTNLNCISNQLITLDISNNKALMDLNCGLNQLTTLDVSNNMALTRLLCSSNQLTSLDLSNNTALTTINCSNNNIEALDLSNNTALTTIDCSNNNMDALDITKCTSFVILKDNSLNLLCGSQKNQKELTLTISSEQNSQLSNLSIDLVNFLWFVNTRVNVVVQE